MTETMTGVYGTRSSERWLVEPGRMDACNLRHIFPSSNAFGIPDLARASTVPSELAAWHVPRQREHAAEHGGAVHCFLDDYRFETAWSSPERAARRVLAVGAALSPDFSLWRDLPAAVGIWQTYRSRWVAAYWQALGVDVVPTVSWSDAASLEYSTAGIARGSVVALSSVGVSSADAVSVAAFRNGLEQVLSRIEPSVVLAYGRLRHVDGLALPRVVEYPTHWDRRSTTSTTGKDRT